MVKNCLSEAFSSARVPHTLMPIKISYLEAVFREFSIFVIRGLSETTEPAFMIAFPDDRI